MHITELNRPRELRRLHWPSGPEPAERTIRCRPPTGLVAQNKRESDLSEEIIETDSMAINEVQLLLAEERTSLSVMRTGIAILALPMSVFSLLVATSEYYEISNVLHFLVPLFVVCLLLIMLGGYLIVRSINNIRHFDKLIRRVKLEHSAIAKFLESMDHVE